LDVNTFTSRFLPGYTTYLAIFYTLGGLSLVFWANALLLFLSLTTFYFIARSLSNARAGLATVLLLATCYLFVWFPRRTVSENLLMLLVFVAVHLFITGWQRKNVVRLSWSLAVISPTVLVRGEAIGYLISFGLVIIGSLVFHHRQIAKRLKLVIPAGGILLVNLFLFWSYGNRYGSDYIKYIWDNASGVLATVPIWSYYLVAATVALLAGASWFWYSQHQKIIELGRRYKLRKIFWGLLLAVFAIWEISKLYWLSQNEYVSWDRLVAQYVFEGFTFYYLPIYILIAYFGFYRGLFPKVIYPALLALFPTLVFLISPSIAVDHPWFMRRFWAVLVPIIILLAVVTLAKIFKSRSQLMIAAVILLVVNLSLSLPIITFRENQGIQDGLQEIANKFTATDLVLLEPGWQWQQWGYALHYVSGVDVLPNLDGFDQSSFAALVKQYEKVYVISSQRDLPFPGIDNSNLEYVSDWQLNYSRLQRNSWLVYYVDHNQESLELAKIREGQANMPPREIVQLKDTYYLYQVIDKNQYNFAQITYDE
ncbi:glycosyltransferase family 39 protein, partial [Patescibacteria group bacterium]|nr:glycosyltransferase family 39 protein [Patescibacteria group bacterium]